MKKTLFVLLTLVSFAQWGCAFLGGAAVGAAGTGAAYEYSNKRQMDKLEVNSCLVHFPTKNSKSSFTALSFCCVSHSGIVAGSFHPILLDTGVSIPAFRRLPKRRGSDRLAGIF